MLIKFMKKVNYCLKSGDCDCMFVEGERGVSGERGTWAGVKSTACQRFDLRSIDGAVFDTRHFRISVLHIAF
jgi:hypothetical protein